MQRKLYDELGDWSKDKLDLLEKYLRAYTKILTGPKQRKWCRGVHYIDGFAGGGKAIDRETQELIDASPLIAVKTDPPFDRLIFIDLKPDRVARLEALKEDYPDRAIEVYKADCNDILVKKVIPSIPPRNQRGFLLLDPYALHIDWNTIETAAESGAIEIMVNFSLHDVSRNLVRSDPDAIPREQQSRMDRLWGSAAWRSVLYPKALFGPQKTQENVAKVLSRAFQERLADVFEYVSDYVIMKNTVKAPLYTLMWAGRYERGCEIMNDIFRKYKKKHS